MTKFININGIEIEALSYEEPLHAQLKFNCSERIVMKDIEFVEPCQVLPEGAIMTLKDIVDLINVEEIKEGKIDSQGNPKTRHSESMDKIEKLAREHSFGSLRKIRIDNIDKNGRKVGVITTCAFTNKQSIAAASKLSNKHLMQVVDRVEELEVERALPTAQPHMTDMEIMSKALTIQLNTISELENRISEDKPYIEYAKSLSLIDHDMCIRDWTKILHGKHGLPDDVGEQMVINLLIKRDVLFRKNSGRLAAKAKWVNNRCFNMRRGVNSSDPEGKGGYDVLNITAKGRDKLSPRVILFFNEASDEDKEKYKNKRKAS